MTITPVMPSTVRTNVTMLEGAVEVMKKVGIFDVFLPFILLYAVIFGILEKVKLFGTDKRASNINSVISFSIALLAITSSWLVPKLQQFLPYIGLASVLVISFFILASIFTGGYEELVKSVWFKVSGIIVAIAIVAYATAASSGVSISSIPVKMDELVSWGVTIGLVIGMVIAIYFITKSQ